jgi:uncharacterized protein (TIGR03083 family)
MTDASTPSATATRDALLAEIETSWNRLQGTIDSLTDKQLTDPTDAAGWSVKDHLAHLAAWENSMVFLFQGKPRHEGLGVPEAVYLDRTEDEINDAIYKNVRDRSLDTVLSDLNDVHTGMLAILETLTGEDLHRTYSHYLPDEPGIDDGSPIIHRVSGNTHEHFDMHGGYIKRIVGAA